MSDTTAEPSRAHARPGAPATAAGVSGPELDGRPVLSHKEILTILVGLMMGMFLAALDQTIVATRDPHHRRRPQRPRPARPGSTTAYLITSTIATPLYGKLGDIYGRKKLFIFAIWIFIDRLDAVHPRRGRCYQLAAFRAVQGIGAGGLFSLALAIIGDIVPPA